MEISIIGTLFLIDIADNSKIIEQVILGLQLFLTSFSKK